VRGGNGRFGVKNYVEADSNHLISVQATAPTVSDTTSQVATSMLSGSTDMKGQIQCSGTSATNVYVKLVFNIAYTDVPTVIVSGYGSNVIAPDVYIATKTYCKIHIPTEAVSCNINYYIIQ
jgi:hypothetical protein